MNTPITVSDSAWKGIVTDICPAGVKAYINARTRVKRHIIVYFASLAPLRWIPTSRGQLRIVLLRMTLLVSSTRQS